MDLVQMDQVSMDQISMTRYPCTPAPGWVAGPLRGLGYWREALCSSRGGGGELAMPGQALIREDHVAALEQALEQLNADLPPLKEFVLPTGPLPVVTTHHARAVCRRAERAVWAVMEEDDDASRLPAVYLNRLSDLLFVIARQLARAANPQEQTWQI